MWSSVPDLHLLAYVFSFCDLQSLLRAEAVCRTWRRAVQLDDRWLRALKELSCLRTKPSEEIYFNTINFGVLNSKDLYFIMLGAERRNYSEIAPQSLNVLQCYKRFRFHPVRHSDPSSPLNIFRLFQCYILNGETSFIHLTRSMRHKAARQAATTRSQVSVAFERLLCRSLRLFYFASGFLSVALIYKFFLSPSHRLPAQSYWRGAACALTIIPVAALSVCTINHQRAIPRQFFASFFCMLYFCRGTTTRLPFLRAGVFLGFAVLMFGGKGGVPRVRRFIEWLSLCMLFAFPDASAAPFVYLIVTSSLRRRLEKLVEAPQDIWRGRIQIK